jgi:hypothetical protein
LFRVASGDHLIPYRDTLHDQKREKMLKILKTANVKPEKGEAKKPNKHVSSPASVQQELGFHPIVTHRMTPQQKAGFWNLQFTNSSLRLDRF